MTDLSANRVPSKALVAARQDGWGRRQPQHLVLEARAPGDRDVGLYQLERLVTDALDQQQVGDLLELPVLLSEVDDPAGDRRPHPGQ